MISLLTSISIFLLFVQNVSTNPVPSDLIPEEILSLLNPEQIQTFYELQAMEEQSEGRSGRQKRASLDPEAYMTVEQIIRYHGYPVEVYNFKTDDGYILTIQRIPYGKSGPGTEKRKPVLIQHGLLCSSASWVTNIAEKNLPYLVADAGYDVWLGNIRGTLFGRNHTHLSPKKKEFWAYSFDEMAKYDIPTIIDNILEITGFSQIYYIGHSMGTAMMFALLSTQPRYNEIVRTFFALAPVAQLEYVRTPIRLVAPFSSSAAFILNLFGSGEFLANGAVIKFLTSTVCISPLRILCENILFVLCGYNIDQLNSTRLPVHLYHTPAATSVQNLVHFAQLVNHKVFSMYDHGAKENQIRYGQKTPPIYNLKKIAAQVALYWSDNDYLASKNDVSWLSTQLDNLVKKYRVPLPKFSHLDFLWAIDVKTLVYNQLISDMKKLWRN